MNKGPVAVTSLLALLLAGCVAAPPTQPQNSMIAAGSLGLSTEKAPQIQQDWWKLVDDPQFSGLFARLLAGNPSLQGALARIRAAQAELSMNRAETYPQLSFDATIERELLTNAYGLIPPFAGSYRWLSDVQAQMTWSLDFWGKQAALVAKARRTASAAALDSAAARLALGSSFAQTYIDLVLAWENLDIANQTVGERQTILELTQSRVTQGLENQASLEQARAVLALAHIEVRRAEAQRDVSIHAVAALLGEGAGAYASIARPRTTLASALPLPSQIPADLLARRPDILAAKARIDAAMQGRQAAHADFYPNINLDAAAGFQAIGLSDLFTSNALTYGAGPAIHLPIFDAGKIRAQYARATADLDAAIADYNATVVGAVRQTADALTQLSSLRDQYQEQKLALDSASRAFHLAEERYRLGLSGQIPMLTAENTLLQSRQQMADLLAQTAIQRISLLLAVGGGLSPQYLENPEEGPEP